MKITDKIEITNEDNMALMARYPDGYFDLAVVDLEYGIGASKPSVKPNVVTQSNGNTLNIKQPNYMQKDWDFQLSSPEYLKELFRVSKEQIIFGGNYYGLAGGYLVWDKLNSESDQFGCEMAWLSFTKRTDVVYYLWSGMMQGESPSRNVKKALRQIGDKKQNEKRIHPTQKPAVLYKWILQEYAKPGFKIIDTHHGSASLSEACHDMGFEIVACEIDADYYQPAVDRIKKHCSQGSLFQPEELLTPQTLFEND